ncbi:hypothetical protein OU426_02285 [Frigidibacter sp. RF13]|uniref:hypothetical protein n=1 Tax=Frigidibacter sp. RF13 TaxID=2997340 RepID=UPI00226E3306|nr:hypothetical protein [Frigidibacter sp. RF13]MCY1125670.1 hypothetical protein [Frigidibacter sp. RF13]
MTDMGKDFSNADRVRETLRRKLQAATQAGQKFITVVSRDLHEATDFASGSHPNQMPTVCNVMHEFRQETDRVLRITPSGRSSTLKIEYGLPRKQWI